MKRMILGVLGVGVCGLLGAYALPGLGDANKARVDVAKKRVADQIDDVLGKMDVQRDFVWGRDQIRLLMDTIMRGYPFGSLLFWQTRFLEVPYRAFVTDFVPGTPFVTQPKPAGTPLRIVLDGQHMLNQSPRLSLNIAQPSAARDTLSWQESPEVDHIFPQSVMRPQHGDLVDDIGNLSYLGKLRNIRKGAEMPAEYFKDVPDDELKAYHLIADRTLLAPDQFEEFVNTRRQLILSAVKSFLSR